MDGVHRHQARIDRMLELSERRALTQAIGRMPRSARSRHSAASSCLPGESDPTAVMCWPGRGTSPRPPAAAATASSSPGDRPLGTPLLRWPPRPRRCRPDAAPRRGGQALRVWAPGHDPRNGPDHPQARHLMPRLNTRSDQADDVDRRWREEVGGDCAGGTRANIRQKAIVEQQRDRQSGRRVNTAINPDPLGSPSRGCRRNRWPP